VCYEVRLLVRTPRLLLEGERGDTGELLHRQHRIAQVGEWRSLPPIGSPCYVRSSRAIGRVNLRIITRLSLEGENDNSLLRTLTAQVLTGRSKPQS
jgi:hypothetical protein